MQLFTQRRASVIWLCKCSSDKHDINVKQRDGRAFTTSKRNIVIDIFHSFSGASSRSVSINYIIFCIYYYILVK